MATVVPGTKQLILKNLYRNGSKVPLMIRNGELIYRCLTKLIFSVDTDELSFDYTGETKTITITANDYWTMTVPEWLTASKLSGMTSATVSLIAGSTESGRTGNIVITCGNKTHTVSVSQVSSLPSKSYVFNYNARDYNASTYTVPNSSGASLQVDMLLTGTSRTGITVSSDHIFIPVGTQFSHTFSSSSANPLNLVSTNNNLTFIFKGKYLYNSDNDTLRGNFFRNQDNSNLNWAVRFGTRSGYPVDDTRISFCHNNSLANFDTGLSYTCGDTITAVVTVNNGVFSIKNIGTGQSTTPITITSNSGYGNNVTKMYTTYTGDFYWMYCSREVLTDAEIQQVVAFNS